MLTLHELKTFCFVILLFLPLTVNGAEDNFRDVLLLEYRLHPLATSQDYYKLIFQSAMGSAHMGIDLQMAKEYLEEEIEELIPDSTEPLFQILSPDSSLIRINIRPYLFRKGNIDSLANAFYLTSQQFIDSEKLLEEQWKVFVNLVKGKEIPLKLNDVNIYFASMKKQDFPAVHHSKMYQEKYKPAYRVILKEYLP